MTEPPRCPDCGWTMIPTKEAGIQTGVVCRTPRCSRNPRAGATTMTEPTPTPLYRCPNCKAGPRPRDEWASRYGVMTCAACLSQGFVIMPEPEPTPALCAVCGNEGCDWCHAPTPPPDAAAVQAAIDSLKRAEAWYKKEKLISPDAVRHGVFIGHAYLAQHDELAALRETIERAVASVDGIDVREGYERDNATPDELRDKLLGCGLQIATLRAQRDAAVAACQDVIKALLRRVNCDDSGYEGYLTDEESALLARIRDGGPTT